MVNIPIWVQEAATKLTESQVRFELLDPAIGLFNCWSTVEPGRQYRFYASRGIIVGREERGIDRLIRLLKRGELIGQTNYFNQAAGNGGAAAPARSDGLLFFADTFRRRGGDYSRGGTYGYANAAGFRN